MTEKFNTNQKIVISMITSPILVYLVMGFLLAEFNLTKWNFALRGGSLVITVFAFVCIFAFLGVFEETKKK